jgi:ABC-type sugar transport system substrate-binding protein
MEGIMKKVFAILLAVLMAASLFACGTGTTASPSPSEASTPSAAPSTAPSAAPSADASAAPSTAVDTTKDEKWEPGFFNHTMDYSKNQRYKVAYMTSSNSALFDTFRWAFGEWAKSTNCDYQTFDSNSDNDLYVNTIMTLSDQGIDGFIFDPDSTVYPRILEVVKEVDKPFMTAMGAAFDENGKLLAPSAGFDNKKFGTDCAEWVIDYAKTNWPDAKPEELGMLSINYSVVPQLQVRTDGAKEIWLKAYPDLEKNFFVSDAIAVGGAMSAQTGYDCTAPIMSANPNIKYWLVVATFDDYADGAARAAEALKIDQNTIIICPGGAEAVAHWEAGETSCWKAVIYSGDGLFSEPIWNGLYAQLHGDATQETLWPDWVDHSKGETYPYLMVPTIVLTYETYKQFIAWEEHYTSIVRYNFTWDGTTTFPGRAVVPASYAG